MTTQRPSKMRLARPQEPEFVQLGHSRYRGRDYYGNHGDELAELAWRRDLCAYLEQELRGFESFARSVNEALNSGDGSYRP